MRRLFSAALSAALIGAALVPGVASAGATKVDVCHFSVEAGSYHLISVAEAAYETHVGHGDGGIGEAVPGQPGYVFDAACQPAAWLLRVNFTNPDNNVVSTIWEVRDTDGNGTFGPGDTLHINGYPCREASTSGPTFFAPATVTDFYLHASERYGDPPVMSWYGMADAGDFHAEERRPEWTKVYEFGPPMTFGSYSGPDGLAQFHVVPWSPSHPSTPYLGLCWGIWASAEPLLTIEWFDD